MNNKMIKSYHYDQNKLTDEWCRKVADHVYFHGGCTNLLHSKNITEIEQYSTGNIDMRPYMRQFKSINRKVNKLGKANNGMQETNKQEMDKINNSFIPLSLITVKLNSATHLIHKVPFDISVEALDSLADEKRERDINFLKNRDKIQAIAQDMSDQLSQGDIDVGGTENSSMEFKKIPFDLDLDDPMELKIFKDIVYKLQPEASYETILQLIYDIKKIEGVDLLNVYDTFKYGVQTNITYNTSITGIPQTDYVYPGEVYAPKSNYNDFRDTSERYRKWAPTVSTLFNMFSNDLGQESKLNDMINGDGGYCKANGLEPIRNSDWNSTSVELIQFFIISIDEISYMENKNGNKRFVDNNTPGSKKMYGQNTYTFYWLPKTNYFFSKEKLGWAYRKQGQEAFVNFPLDIYKSQKKSAVENCIGENKKAQIADIKLMFTILKSGPPGKYFDIKYIRKATESLLFEGKTQAEVMMDLIDVMVEDNTMIGDSEGMDGQNEGQFKPFQEIPGGLKSEINGYLSVMQQASANISRYTGINDELAGLSSNPDLLNGARKMNISYGMNAINYAYVARLVQYRNVFEIHSWYVKDAIEKGGIHRKTIESMIGQDRTKKIADIGTIKDHTFFLRVNLGMRQEEQHDLQQSLAIMEQKGQLSRMQRFIIDQTQNLKEASLLLASIEEKIKKKEEEKAQQGFAQAQQLQQQRNEGLQAAEQAKAEGKDKNVYVQGDVASKLMELGNQLNLSEKQMEAVIKQKLQGERLNAGAVKQDRNIQTKKEQFEAQQMAPLV